MPSAQFMVDAFRQLLSKGMTHLEALREFDQAEWRATLSADIGEGGQQMLDLAALAGREEMNETDMEQAIELWLAGWASETPSKSQVDVMSWYWRRPGKRPGKPGRLFLSTNQAHRALQKEKTTVA